MYGYTRCESELNLVLDAGTLAHGVGRRFEIGLGV